MGYQRAWDETSPADTDKAGNGAQEIRHFKVDIKQRYDDVARGEKRIAWNNITNTSLPTIVAGSWCEIAGEVRPIDSLVTPSGTPSDGEVYIKLVDTSGTITAVLTSTAPVWDDTYFGWYGESASADHRYIMHLKKSGTSYSQKVEYNGNLPSDDAKTKISLRGLPANTSGFLNPILFTTTKYDIKSEYSSGYVTVKKTGYYHIDALATIGGTDTSSVSSGSLYLYANSVSYTLGQMTGAGLGFSMCGGKDVYLEAGQTVSLYASWSGTAGTTSLAVVEFTMHEL
jgi:hypothetical protein